MLKWQSLWVRGYRINNKNMEKSKKCFGSYGLYIVIFAFSFFFAYSVQTSEFFKGILALPAAGSLIVILYELYRDNRDHERVVEFQNKQQDFDLALASHMADVAYDKHTLFCEEYMNRVQKGFKELIDGPIRKSLPFSIDLVDIRKKYSSWLTKEIEVKLKPFEHALAHIGSKDQLIDILPVGEKKDKLIEDVNKYIGLIMGHEEANSEEEKEIAKDSVIEEIRNILGINTLSRLRKRATDLALERIENDNFKNK